MATYARLGVLDYGVYNYSVYNPRYAQRDQHAPSEVYCLEGSRYQKQTAEPYWMPEVGLGIGRCVLPSDPLGREILTWFDRQNERYLLPEEVERAKRSAMQVQTARKLLAMGLLPDQVAIATDLSLEAILLL